jgi:hypothetical protein
MASVSLAGISFVVQRLYRSGFVSTNPETWSARRPRFAASRNHKKRSRKRESDFVTHASLPRNFLRGLNQIFFASVIAPHEMQPRKKIKPASPRATP